MRNFVLLIFVICFTSISLFSCHISNPVVNPPPVTVDTSDQYIWKGIGSGNISNIYAADTNRIYLFYYHYTYVTDGYYFQRVYFANPEFVTGKVKTRLMK